MHDRLLSGRRTVELIVCMLLERSLLTCAGWESVVVEALVAVGAARSESLVASAWVLVHIVVVVVVPEVVWASIEVVIRRVVSLETSLVAELLGWGASLVHGVEGSIVWLVHEAARSVSSRIVVLEIIGSVAEVVVARLVLTHLMRTAAIRLHAALVVIALKAAPGLSAIVLMHELPLRILR